MLSREPPNPRLGRISFRQDEGAVPRLLGAGLVRILLPTGAAQSERQQKCVLELRYSEEALLKTQILARYGEHEAPIARILRASRENPTAAVEVL